jgi:hypothetical protein
MNGNEGNGFAEDGALLLAVALAIYVAWCIARALYDMRAARRRAEREVEGPVSHVRRVR